MDGLFYICSIHYNLEKEEILELIYSILKLRQGVVKDDYKYEALTETFSKLGTLLKASAGLLLQPLFLFL